MDDDHAQSGQKPDVDVFARFYARHYPTLLNVARQRLIGMADAEDITAETFRISWMHHLSGGDLTLRWAYRTLRNVIGNEYQRLARAEQLRVEIGPLYTDRMLSPDSDDALDVRRLVNELREEDRELIYMAYWEDLSRNEIAEILRLSPITVRVRLLRARRALQVKLGEGAVAVEEVDDGRV